MKVKLTAPNPEYEAAVERFHYEYVDQNRGFYPLETLRTYIDRRIYESRIERTLEVTGEMVHVNYESFECVVLCKGKYKKVSLDEVTVIEEDGKEEK